MRSRTFLATVSLMVFVAGAFVVSAQQDEGVRGAFLESRPKTTDLKGPSRRHRRRPAKPNANASAVTNTNTTQKAGGGSMNIGDGTQVKSGKPARAQTAIGLG